MLRRLPAIIALPVILVLAHHSEPAAAFGNLGSDVNFANTSKACAYIDVTFKLTNGKEDVEHGIVKPFAPPRGNTMKFDAKPAIGVARSARVRVEAKRADCQGGAIAVKEVEKTGLDALHHDRKTIFLEDAGKGYELK
jgi:hypothetical protein